jgi:IS1 family transposase
MLDTLNPLKHNVVIMNRLNKQKQAQIIASLVEGSSLRATARMCDVAFNTVLKLVPEIGKACADYQNVALRNLTSKLIQCDEIWSFCYAKDKNVPADLRGQFGYGDVWTWVAIDADTKLVPCFMVGTRGAQTANRFMRDLASRLANRVQLTTDGHRVYLQAVENAFGSEIDYAMLVKIYGNDAEAEMCWFSLNWRGDVFR